MKTIRFTVALACFAMSLGAFPGNVKGNGTPTLAVSDSAKAVGLLADAFCRSLVTDSQAISREARAFIDGAMPLPSPGFVANVRKWDDAKAWQAVVWQAWWRANGMMASGRLPRLRSLADSVTGAWTLPATLEPSARMDYFWGSKGDNPTASPLPMYLYLHGSGPRDMEWTYGRRWAMMFNDSPSLYFIPRIPNMGEYYRWWQLSKQYAWEKLLRQTLSGGLVDANRVYVLGISEGGYGGQRLASFYADYLAAAGPMAGGEPLRNAPPENCANIGFSLLTGALDYGFYRNKLTGRTAEAFDSLSRANVPADASADSLFRHRVWLMPKRGHAIDYRLTTPWLRTFVRNPYPRKVMWEDFEMDGRHRRGFYNLCVERRPTAGGDGKDARTYYVMDIKDNDITLTVSNVEYDVTERDPQWGIELNVAKRYTEASGGRLRIYLNDRLVDLNRKVTVRVNGKKVFSGKLKPSLDDMVSSCKLWFDPCRVFPTSVTVEY